MSGWADMLVVQWGCLGNIRRLARFNNYSGVFLLCDGNVRRLFKDQIENVFHTELSCDRFFILPDGESAKSLKMIEEITSRMLTSGLDRQSLLVSAGGGVTTDIGGLAASLFMRGIDFINVPTTLVGQIDAAIGGKCAVNLSAAKNIIGLFTLPKRVLIDPAFLETLAEDRIKDGLVELVKIAAVCDSGLFYEIQGMGRNFLELGKDEISNLIKRGAHLKLDVVRKDFRERGLRQILNFGHTTGHALEALVGYDFISHGQAVAFGILVALEISRETCGLNITAFESIKKVILGILAKVTLANIDAADLFSRMSYDKKKKGNGVNFVLLKELGIPLIQPVGKEEFIKAYSHIMQELEK